jgi:hypothetical protein
MHVSRLPAQAPGFLRSRLLGRDEYDKADAAGLR